MLPATTREKPELTPQHQGSSLVLIDQSVHVCEILIVFITQLQTSLSLASRKLLSMSKNVLFY